MSDESPDVLSFRELEPHLRDYRCGRNAPRRTMPPPPLDEDDEESFTLEDIRPLEIDVDAIYDTRLLVQYRAEIDDRICTLGRMVMALQEQDKEIEKRLKTLRLAKRMKVRLPH